jgi:PAS domain S-box-containing protein
VKTSDSTDRQRWADLAEELAGLGYWRRDTATGAMAWSPNMFRIYGFEPGPEPTLQDILDRVHPQDVEASRDWIQALAAGVTGDILTRVVWPDGAIRWLEVRGACERAADGAVSAMIGVVMDATERHESQATLAAHQVHMNLLAEHGGDLIMELDATGVLQYVSPAIRRLGYEPDELIGRRPSAIVHAEDLPKLQKMGLDYLSGNPIDPVEDRAYRLMSRDGRSIWVEGKPTAIRGPAGEITGVISVLRDVSDRRAVEVALAERAAQLHVVTAHTHDVILQYDLDQRIIYASPAASRYGYAPDNLVGKPVTVLLHPEDLERVTEAVAETISGAAPTGLDRRLRMRTADGLYRWIESQPQIVRDPQGKPVSVVTLLRDIDAQKVADDALAESERRYRLLADHATDIIACYDDKGRFSFLSPSVAAVLGYTPQELMGQTSAVFMHPDDVEMVWRTFTDFFTANSGAESTRVEYRAFRKDGQMIWLECHPRAVFGPDDRFVEFQDVVRDVTVYKVLAEELRLARDSAEAAAAVKSDFMANMSQEIRTPLTAVIGFSSLISARSDLDPTAREHADRIAGAGRALLDLVNDVLDFSKLEAGRMELEPRPVDPCVLAREALDLFTLQAESKGLDLTFAPTADLPACVALDAKAVGQVLRNLIGNAVKFSEAGGVTLALAYDIAAESLMIEVRDTGPGLTSDEAGRLFKRFSQVDGSSTRRHGGTGLGLAISKGLVEAMDGEIGVDSVPGRGSTFWFTLPAPPAEPAHGDAEDDNLVSLEGLKVLVVDDNPVNRELVSLILSPLGLEVATAVDGLTGLERAMRLPYDLILLDIRMPGLDGPGVLARLRSQEGPNRGVPILAFSADFEADPAHAFDDFVSKPLEPATLIQTIARWTVFQPDDGCGGRRAAACVHS